MALSADIYRRFAPKSVDDYDREAYDAENGRQRNVLNDLKLLGAQREEQDAVRAAGERNALTQLFVDPTFDRRAPDAQQRLYKVAPTQAASVIKGWRDQDKADAELAETKAKTTKVQGEASTDAIKRYRGALDFIDTPQGAARWLQAQYADPVLAAHMQAHGPFEQAVAHIPQDPQGFEQWRQRAGMGMEKWAEQQRLAAAQQETGRHNRATEATSAGQLAVAQGNLGVSRQHLQLDRTAPRGQIVQSDQGTMLVDPRTGQSVAVVGPDGSPLGPKLKDIPAPAQKAMLENNSNLRRAQQALALAQGKEVGEMKGDTSATGWKGYLPNDLLNRWDESGVDTRAAIADLGSLVIHDRSGAAVSAAEFPRLAPFIPTEKDDSATVEKKLKRFVQVYQEEVDAMNSAYGRDTGYRASPVGAAPTPPLVGAPKKPAPRPPLSNFQR